MTALLLPPSSRPATIGGAQSPRDWRLMLGLAGWTCWLGARK